MEKLVCERCGLETSYSIGVKYYDRAKQTLCDCCIDIFDGQSWGYDSLKRNFGKNQAKKMMTLGFEEVPFGFKINRGSIGYLGYDYTIENMVKVAEKLNSELDADNKLREAKAEKIKELDKRMKKLDKETSTTREEKDIKQLKKELLEIVKDLAGFIEEDTREEK